MSEDLPQIDLPRDSDASGRDLGDIEIALVTQALRSGTLNSTRGTFVKRLERAFAARMNAAHGLACGSGTGAIHTALAGIGVGRGDEVITTAITDIGAITPILYEGATPVFCDVDPRTAVVTAETIAARVTPRTRAVIVTHLFGLPCAMGPILELADQHGFAVIEDCAQAFLAVDSAGPIGTLGAVGCYSFQQGKHMTTGEGGAVITDDAAVARRMRKFVDKGWGYGEAAPDHDFPALNGRLTELQGAVGLGQLAKLDHVVARRQKSAAWMREQLTGLAGISTAPLRPGVEHVYWKFVLHVDENVIPGGPSAVAERLARQGVASAPHYIRKPAYRTAVFKNWRDHSLTASVYEAAGTEPEPPAGTMRGTDHALASMLVLPWNEHYTPEHLSALRDAIRRAATVDSEASSGAG